MIIVRHSEIDNICMGLNISLSSNLNHLISLMTPRITSNFRHLLGCGTIEGMYPLNKNEMVCCNIQGVPKNLPESGAHKTHFLDTFT